MDLRLWLNPESECQLNLQPKHIAIIREVFRPEVATKIINVCCGIAFGKSTLAVIIASIILEMIPGSMVLFLEPDYSRINSVFWAEWKKWIPSEKYKWNSTTREITWYTDGGKASTLILRARWVTGNTDTSSDLGRGPNLTAIIDDESAIGFNLELAQNLLGRLRRNDPISVYIDFSTPKVGQYGDWLAAPGHVLFRGKTSDNAANLRPGFVERTAAQMSPNQRRRELDGELIALEGRIWTAWDDVQNLSDATFQPGKPFILAGDIGVISSWLIIQIFGNEETIVGEYHPDDGGTARDITFIVGKYGVPAKIITGHDLTTRNVGTGLQTIIEIKSVLSKLGKSTTMPMVSPRDVDPAYMDKGLQFQAAETAIYQRRLKLSRSLVEKNMVPSRYIDGNHGRSFIKMIQQDSWPKPGKAGFFIKDKGRGSGIEDVRDAFLYYCVCMHPPTVRG